MQGDFAVVTAAAQGIGRAIALALHAEGARVVAVDLQADRLSTLPDAIEGRVLDLCDAKAVASFAEQLETPTVLVNAVGWVHHGSILDCDQDAWSRSFETNVSSMYYSIRSFLPGMLAAGTGSIVNIASVASSVSGVIDRFAYGTTKAAVIGLTKSVAADTVTRGIRCNAICPGTVQSPSLDERIAATGEPEAARARFIARQPMGRLGEPEEIAALAVHLASRESAYTTGSVYVIDGGMTL